MKFNKMIERLDKAYSDDGSILAASKGFGDGDGLARFVVTELRDVLGHLETLKQKDLEDAARAIGKGIEELGRVHLELVEMAHERARGQARRAKK